MFVNGHFSDDLSDIQSDPDGVMVGSLARALERGDPGAVVRPGNRSDRAFSALNDAFAADGSVIRLAEGVSLQQPIQLLFVSIEPERPRG